MYESSLIHKQLRRIKQQRVVLRSRNASKTPVFRPYGKKLPPKGKIFWETWACPAVDCDGYRAYYGKPYERMIALYQLYTLVSTVINKNNHRRKINQWNKQYIPPYELLIRHVFMHAVVLCSANPCWHCFIHERTALRTFASEHYFENEATEGDLATNIYPPYEASASPSVWVLQAPLSALLSFATHPIHI